MRFAMVVGIAVAACSYAPPRVGPGSDAISDATIATDATELVDTNCATCGQFDLVAVADSYLRAQFPDEIHATDVFQRCGSGDPANCCTNRAIYRFDLGLLPMGCVIQKAELKAYFYEQDYPGESPIFGVHHVTADWTEAQVTWNRRTSAAWASPGGDFDPTPVVSVIVADGAFGFITFDITPLAIAWHAGTQPNFGAIVVEPGDLQGVVRGRKRFRTREAIEIAERPHLAVTCTE